MSWFKNTFEISHTMHKTIVSMEGIRGFAVFLVFLAHYVTLIEPWINESTMTYLVSRQIRNTGNIGVDLFFVLSGYLIYGMLIRKERSFVSYIFRRIQRIYPAFTMVFLIYLAVSFIFPAESKIPQGWEGLLFILQNFLLLPGLFEIKPIITVAWSLSYEFFYYLLIPLLINSLKLRAWKCEQRLFLFLATSILLCSYFAFYGGHIRLLMFVSGIVLFEVIAIDKLSRIPSVGVPALILAVVSVILLNSFNIDGWWKYALLFCLFFVFCLDCFGSSRLANRIFSVSPMRWLGNMSYSYYLIHGLSLKFIFLIMSVIYPSQGTGVWLFWIALPLAFILTLIPSVMLFIFIEKPFSLSIKAH